MLILIGIVSLYVVATGEAAMSEFDGQTPDAEEPPVLAHVYLQHEAPQWTSNPFLGATSPPDSVAFIPVAVEWASRQVRLNDGRAFVYEFGQGNPAELALAPTARMSCSLQEAGLSVCTDNGAGYVSAALEAKLIAVLSSPQWLELLRQCEPSFRIVDQWPRASGNDSGPLVDMAAFVELGRYISMERLITVNLKTGRKNMSVEGYQRLQALYEYLALLRELEVQGAGLEASCVHQHGSTLIDDLAQLRAMPWSSE